MYSVCVCQIQIETAYLPTYLFTTYLLDVCVCVIVAAVGCRDPLVSEFSWMERRGEQVTIGCNCTEQTWHLVCKGTKWVGDVGRCQPCHGMRRANTIRCFSIKHNTQVGL